MSKNNIKKLIVTLISVLLLVSVAYTTYAVENNPFVEEMLKGEGNNINVEDGELQDIKEGNKTNTNKEKNTNTNNNTNSNENKPATTPHAGLGDYSGLIFVGIFGVSAIYAYKKVKEYNV